MRDEVPASTAVRSPSGHVGLSAVTTVLAAAMPKCPVCWMALAGALGVGSTAGALWLRPAAAFFLLVTVGALLLRARSRRSYGPFALGLAAAASMYVCKFTFGYDAGAYLCGAVLLGASVWNALPRRGAGKATTAAGCPCGPSKEGEPHGCKDTDEPAGWQVDLP